MIKNEWLQNGKVGLHLTLIKKIRCYSDGHIMTEPMNEVLIGLSTANAPKRDCKGNPYIDIITHHLPKLDALKAESR